MEIGSYFIKGTSSASYILNVCFETDNGVNATMHLSVSPGVCYTADGKMEADAIYLYPWQENGDIGVGKKSIYSATTLDDLCGLLFDAATIEGWQDPMAEINKYRAKVNGKTFAIDGKLKYYYSHKELTERIEKLGGRVSGSVSSENSYLICNNKDSASRKASKARELGIPIISDLDFGFGLFGKDVSCDGQGDCSDDGKLVSVRDVAPNTVCNFKKACNEAGITLENLKIITIQNSKLGWRDSAKFIFCDNPVFYEYKKMYRNASDEQKREIAEQFIEFVKAEPMLEINDNEFELPGVLPCKWNGNDESLEEAMRAYLEGNDPGHWMGTYSKEFTIDVVGRSVTSREVLFYGNI